MQHSPNAGEGRAAPETGVKPPITAAAAECVVVSGDTAAAAKRLLVAEEPLRIVVAGRPVATLMRTPGNETELALGFVLTEGIVRSPDDVGAISISENRVDVAAAIVIPAKAGIQEQSTGSAESGAGLVDRLAAEIAPFDRPPGRFSPGDVFSLVEEMSRQQVIFRQAGGTHAAAIGRPPVGPGSDVIVREDLGRHNALDKAVGAAAQRGLAARGLLLALSARLSFEMVAKAARVGISDVAGISAPSALAVALARRLNMFLAGFVRGRTMTVYSGRDALSQPTPEVKLHVHSTWLPARPLEGGDG